MKDLKITYNREKNVVVEREYETIMDFLDEVDAYENSEKILNCTNVGATFFENPANYKYFDTVGELYNHCKMII